jgi:pimeloyl-ACP methyl ester carboxylesterase
MGAQQAFHWAALFPDRVDGIAPICGSAKTSAHNFVFLEGVKAALTADPVWQDGWFATPPTRVLPGAGPGRCRPGAEPGVLSRGDLAQDRLLLAGGLS